MELLPENINKFVPYGATLKEVLLYSSLSKTAVKDLLRNRGIFMSENRADQINPLLSTCLLSPKEFDQLKDKITISEDREKVFSRNITWDSNETLINSVPQNININEILGLDKNFRVNGTSNFSMIDNDPNNVELNYTGERTDLSKSWYISKSQFKGKIQIKRIEEDGQVKFKISHTAPETKEIGRKLTNTLVKHFKDKGFVKKEAKVEEIKFNSFRSNEERVKFFWSLTGEDDFDIFSFSKILDAEIAPDLSQELPEDIKWMSEGQVRKLILDGETIHDTPFFKDNSLHKYLVFASMDAKFKIDLPTSTGNCTINFGFHGYLRNKDVSTIFDIDIRSINLDNDRSPQSREEVRKVLLDEFSRLKDEKYNWIVKQRKDDYTPPPQA